MKKLTVLLAAAVLALCLMTGCGKARDTQQNTGGTLQVPVTLTGGSGKASVMSPAEIRMEDGSYTAVIRWSSSNYDYMVVDGTTYEPVSTHDGSVFEIPIPEPPCTVSVQADTVAMSKPHLIDYTLTFGEEGEMQETGTATGPEAVEDPETESTSDAGAYDTPDDESYAEIPGLKKTGSLETEYAALFSVDEYENGLKLISIPDDDSRFLLVPEGEEAPRDLPSDICVLQMPIENIYLASTAVMDFFAACDALPCVRFAGLKQDEWAIAAARNAMEEGSILYAGKYSAPDYEQIYASGCGLAVENTMIYHSPEVREQLESFDIPVLVDDSSYETTPQGRMEWIRLYGILTGHEAEAEEAYREQIVKFDALSGTPPSGKTVAYFYINSTGAAAIRRSNDYIPALIRLAGGEYAFPDMSADEGSHSTTVVIQMEEFYAGVKDVDYLIYSSDITGAPSGTEELIKKYPLLENCRAFQEDRVFCTTGNLYQSVMEMGDFVTDLHRMLTEEDPEMTYLYKLE